MSSRIKYILTIIGILTMIVMAVIAPSAISGYQDRKVIDNIMTEPIEQSTIVAQSGNLEVIDCIDFIYHSGVDINAKMIMLDEGNQFTWDTIYDHFIEELDKLEKLGALPRVESDIGDPDRIIISPELYINVNDISQSIIFWNISYQDDWLNIKILMDDESGKIMSLVYETKDPIFTELEFQQMIKAFVGYLGLSIEEFNGAQFSEDEPTTYLMESDWTIYRLNLSDGNKAVNYDFGMQPYGMIYGVTLMDFMSDFIFSIISYLE